MWVKGRAPCGVLGQRPDWVALGAVRPLQGEALAPCKGVDSMAVKVESIAAERDQALARAERADQRATAAYADANRQLSEKIKEVEADRPSLKMQTEVVQLRMENDSAEHLEGEAAGDLRCRYAA